MINKLMFKIIFMKFKLNMDEFEFFCVVIFINLILWFGLYVIWVMLMLEELLCLLVIVI